MFTEKHRGSLFGKVDFWKSVEGVFWGKSIFEKDSHESFALRRFSEKTRVSLFLQSVFWESVAVVFFQDRIFSKCSQMYFRHFVNMRKTRIESFAKCRFSTKTHEEVLWKICISSTANACATNDSEILLLHVPPHSQARCITRHFRVGWNGIKELHEVW